MNGAEGLVRDATFQVRFEHDKAEGFAKATLQVPEGSLIITTTSGIFTVTGGQPTAVSWQGGVDAAYAAAASDPEWMADRVEIGDLIEGVYEVDEDGAG
jgi:hypothetical protein